MAFILLEYVSITQLLILAVGLTLLPLVSDMINLYIPIGRVLNKYMSIALVSLLYMLSCSALYSFYFVFLPFYHKIGWLQQGPLSWSIVAVALWMWFNTNYTYTKTLFTSPSQSSMVHQTHNVDQQVQAQSQQHQVQSMQALEQPNQAPTTPSSLTHRNITKDAPQPQPQEQQPQPQPPQPQEQQRYCQECKVYKSFLTHHCSQCNKCIPNMVCWCR
jgi:hypothetical protein